MLISFTSFCSKARWRLGNKELSQLWKWADQNPVWNIHPFTAFDYFVKSNQFPESIKDLAIICFRSQIQFMVTFFSLFVNFTP